MNYVTHNRTKTREQAFAGDKNTIYYTTDDHSIIINGKSYGKKNGGYVYIEEYGDEF
jgi:hypothetical protein